LQVKHAATALSTVLIREHGLQPGDTVSLFGTNSVWYPVAMWAVIRAGGRVNGASPAYGEEEMAYALRTAGTKVLMTMPGAALETALRAAEKAGVRRRDVLLLEGEAEGFESVRSCIERGMGMDAHEPWSLPKGASNKRVCGYLNFSSGTSRLKHCACWVGC
jgi:4-coumarate--CoA ligase